MSPKKTKKKKTTARKTKAKRPSKRKTTAGRSKSRRATSRKTTKKATGTKTATTANLKIGKMPFKKAEMYNYIAAKTELSKKEIVSVFEALGDVIEGHLKKAGPGEFTLPGLLKCKVQRKPATKARKGINPFTGEEMTFKAKPARNVVKVRPLKKLKEMVK